mmetsp:Transcript_7780/g.23318  ORF Transcript_7780/g.23318 Transcript_7780/m.23318 type:complete len:496 (-) Transcript_7780:543-2030(-)
MPFGYAGGPVVAEAMKDLFAADSFDYTDGYPLSLLSATVGMFAGVILGAILVNLAPLSTPLGGARGAPPGRTATGDGMCCASSATAAARPRTTLVRRLRKSMADLAATAPDSDHYPSRMREHVGVMHQTVSVESVDSLAFHLCITSLTLFGGYLMRIPVVLIEQLFPTGSFWERSNLLSVLPLFLFCLLAGLLIQSIIDSTMTDKTNGQSFIDRQTIVRISNTSQDILIVTAIARLGRNGLPPGIVGLGPFFSVIARSGIPFLLVCAGGLVWGVLSFWYVAPLLLPDFWAERALVEFGVSIGATSTGMLLLRMVDPDNSTPVLRDFTCKQIFHVLITGGGFFDVLVPIPLTSTSDSCLPLLIATIVLIGICLCFHPTVHRRIRACLPGSSTAPVLSRTAAARTAEMALAVEAVRGAYVPGDDSHTNLSTRAARSSHGGVTWENIAARGTGSADESVPGRNVGGAMEDVGEVAARLGQREPLGSAGWRRSEGVDWF